MEFFSAKLLEVWEREKEVNKIRIKIKIPPQPGADKRGGQVRIGLRNELFGYQIHFHIQRAVNWVFSVRFNFFKTNSPV